MLVDEYICGNPDNTRAEVEVLVKAKEIATATATAIATVYAECVASALPRYCTMVHA